MTTSISSGKATFSHAISIGDQVTVKGMAPSHPGGQVIEIAFTERSLRGCVRSTDYQGRLQIDWMELDDLQLIII